MIAGEIRPRDAKQRRSVSAKGSAIARERYKNQSGNSGVVEYETGPNFIRVWFLGGEGYEYDYTKPGEEAVESMKMRAEAGVGLATYISQHIGKKYARKL